MTYYDEMAQSYNELYGEEQGKKLRLIAEHLKTSDQDSILDVGCGTGLSANYFKGKITGIDPSKKLLKQCPFPTVVGFAESLPFPDHSFDQVICVSAIHNMEDPKKAMEEMCRVGKSHFVISLLKKTSEEKKEQIKSLIQSQFEVVKVLDEEKDDVFVLQSKTI
ncbi:MAG TPA: class I SAM-dependent methyltransferase [Candidatus Nanoarchaeia archaeon]|nr:class I SAM-dependent methyltransferase [Candidatus Nanoarchaeia archaeon]